VIKGFLLFLLLFGGISSLIFFGNLLTKKDLLTSGKFILAALASLAISMSIYLLEMY